MRKIVRCMYKTKMLASCLLCSVFGLAYLFGPNTVMSVVGFLAMILMMVVLVLTIVDGLHDLIALILVLRTAKDSKEI